MGAVLWAVLALQWAARAVAWAWSGALALLTPRCRVPPTRDPLLLIPATELAAGIRAGKVSSERVVRAYAARVREVDPLVNAVVDDRLAAALEDACRVDRLVAAGKAPPWNEQPLLGVPFTVKGSLAVQGLKHASACTARADIRAAQDADVVRRLREAGAIPLLVSTTPEYCLFYETHSPLHGVTRNPYDTRRTPGGSSGGEGALLGSAASLVSLCSDVGGSARLPALFCGVFGHKPSAGLVSDEGHLPVATDARWPAVFSVAPMCRYASDLPLVLHLMAGPRAERLQLLQPVDAKSVRVFYMEDDGGSVTCSTVHPELREAMRKVIAALEKTHSTEAKKVHIEELKRSIEFTAPVLLGTSGLQHPMAPKVRDNVGWALLQYLLGHLPHSLYVFAYTIGYKITQLIPDDVIKKLDRRSSLLRERFCDLLGDDGVLLYPTYVSPAGFLYGMYGQLVNPLYTAVFNVLGLPATHCPTGLSKQGLPLGIQVIAGPDQDRLCLAVAREIEAAFGGWVQPSQ